jgi:predicted heme/steroid binding protein
MPFDRPHFYLTFGGTLYPLASGHEQWQTGLHFATNASGADVGDYLSAQGNISTQDILARCTDLINGVYGFNTNWSNVVTVDWVKLAVKDVDGKYAGAAKVSEQAPDGGGAGAFPFAPQLAVAVSFWSGSTFGRANRGRMYLPPPNALLTSLTVSEPRATVATANDLRDAIKTWLGHVAGEVSTIPLPTYPAIMSSLGTGTTKPIVQISAGRVIDTMRSRRQALEEDPTWVAYP